MPRTLRRPLGWSFASLLVAGLGFVWFAGLLGAWQQRFIIDRAGVVAHDDSLWLPFYRVAVDARPVEGVANNLSGLTFGTSTGTLFAAINRPPELVELSPEGRLLRRIPLIGGQDVESITYVGGTRFLVLDEATSRVHAVDIHPETQAINLAERPSVALDAPLFGNFGFEGLSWDQRNGILFTTQEMLPARVLAISGLMAALEGAARGLTVAEWQPKLIAGHSAVDLTSVNVHDPTGNILLLSHMSELLTEFSPDGAPISSMSLRGGQHGLAALVPQAEGVAVGGDGAIYIVSEPNLFYRFDRGQPASWMERP